LAVAVQVKDLLLKVALAVTRYFPRLQAQAAVVVVKVIMVQAETVVQVVAAVRNQGLLVQEPPLQFKVTMEAVQHQTLVVVVAVLVQVVEMAVLHKKAVMVALD
jgi:hypothetical protein